MGLDTAASSGAEHWEMVHRTRSPRQVSWYQECPRLSLDLISGLDLDASSPIIDVGGGSSTLVDHILRLGFVDVTVLDISEQALATAQERLDSDADRVTWVHGDVIDHRFSTRFALWHDRAAFHFLCDPADKSAYAAQMRTALRPGGSAIIATFALDGPSKCSGLQVQQYGPDSMTEAFSVGFEPIRFELENHSTPNGTTQRFTYGLFART